jgi:HPt (histidine-containing phosphotransfer) domain-containing protein
VQRSTVHLPEALKRVLERWVSEDRDLRAAATITAASDGSIGEDGEEGLLNRRVLATLRELQQEGEPDLLDELIELFLADVPPRLTALRTAVEAGDAHSVERIAHALKGSCANMGAVGMVALCTELVETGRSGQLLIAPTLSPRLEEEFEQVRAVIEKELSKN